MLRLLAGAALMPLSGALAWVSARTLAGVAVGGGGAAPFAAGLGLSVAAWLVGRQAPAEGPLGAAARAARWCYVLGHELTHALAAWATGGSVFGLKVGADGGHADVSTAGAFVSLAPYCFPFHACAVALAYRALLWASPDAGGEALFLFLMGAALAFHLLLTWDALTLTRQPDLAAAGGRVFSWSVIAAANGLLVLLLLKVLFPGSVPLMARLGEAGGLARRAWSGAWTLASASAAAAARARP